MKKKTVFISLFLGLFGAGIQAQAAAGRTEAGLSFLEAPSARAAALGEAFTVSPNDISGFTYNPANLFIFEQGQGSFLFHKGTSEDSFGQVMLGYPRFNDAFGVSIGHYDGGDIDVFDGTSQRTVKGQSDLIFSMGYSRHWRQRVAYGVTGKVIKSELGEVASANAYAADAGVVIPLHKRLMIGGSVQNIGSQLQYVSEAADLPRIARAGLSWQMIQGKYGTQLFLDAPYYMNQQELNPAIGLETVVGPLALRAGYKQGSDLEEFSIGTGFHLGRSFMDYSFGLVDQLESRHRISVSMRFGSIHLRPGFLKAEKAPVPFVHKPKKTKSKPKVVRTKKAPLLFGNFRVSSTPKARVYIVKQGDTLKSIASKYYGYKAAWDTIANANQHLKFNSDTLIPGQKIVLPRRMWK